MSADPRAHVRAAEEALFDRAGNGIGLRERGLVGAFAAALIAPGGAYAAERAARLDARDAVLVEGLADSAAQPGPWGTYREPDLAGENTPGEWWRVQDALRDELGEALVAVLEHAHLLLLHPRDARPEALEALVSAGWGREAIVTWSQLVSFAAFRARVVAGLAVLAGKES